MKSPFQQYFIVIICILMSPLIVQGSITESFAFPADDMTLTTDTIDGVAYCKVSYYDTYNTGETAHPSLPVKYYTFSIPWNATNITVSANVLDTNIISAPATVFPTQAQQPTDGTISLEFTLPDSTIYNTEAYYPSQITKIANEGYQLGDNHILTIAVNPIQYNPVTRHLKVNNEIYLNITYSLVNKNDLPTKIISRNDLSLKEQDLNSIKAIVQNPSNVEEFATPFSPAILPSSTTIPLCFEYVIITSKELAPAFERLVAFKRAKGYNIGIVTMEEILDCDIYKNGDVFSNIIDDAGKLRAYLNNAYMTGTKYALLGGKEPHVPIRTGYSTSEKYKNPMTNYVPSDLYFRDLNSNWNKNNNSIYGEVSDDIEYNSDIAVGRLLCTTPSEVNNYIDKLIKHDLNPGNGDYSYINRAFYTYSYSMMSHGDTTKIESIIQDIYPEYTRICQNESFPTGAYVISQINQVKPYFMSFHNHGNPEGVQLTDTPDQYSGTNNTLVYGVNAIDSERAHHKEEVGNGLDNISNYNWPGIMYSMSCTTMPFDDYSISDKTANLTINFGESYTLGKNYGGVAYLGNTRAGFQKQSTTIEKFFLEELKKGNTTISCAEDNSLIKSDSHHIKLAHNLLGDPTIDVWTGIPEKYTDADIDIYRDDSKISIMGSCLENAKIVVINTSGDIFTDIGKENGGTYFYTSPNSSIMIYKHNMIPYIPTLCLQNENIYVSQRVFATDVKLGSNVDGNRTSGNIAFCNNVNYIIDATGSVEINPGLIIQNTASVTINTPGTVIIKGGTILSGGSLNINAKEVIMDGNFTTENGANLIIQQNNY